VTAARIDQAADNLLRIRDTHIDSLMERIKEPRFARIIMPMPSLSTESPSGYREEASEGPSHGVLRYRLDLGHIKNQAGKLCPANPIYAGAIVRHLDEAFLAGLPEGLSGKWMDAKGIDMTGLPKEFSRVLGH
jgi:hypothetical protein